MNQMPGIETTPAARPDEIELDEGWECRRLAEIFDVSSARLREAIRRVGINFDALGRELSKSRA